MSAANAKKERSAAVIVLDSKIINLESLTSVSKAAELDNAWYAIKEELKQIEIKHNAYKLAVMSENNDEMPTTGPTSAAVLNQWYSDEIKRVHTAEKDYRTKRYTEVEKQLNEALDMLKTEAARVQGKKADSLEAVEAAGVMLEKAYSVLKPLMNQAASVVPAAKEGEMSDSTKTAMAKYHEAKRTQSEVRAEFDRKLREGKETRDNEMATAEAARTARAPAAGTGATGARTAIKFKPLDNPIFNGEIRDYYRWRDDFLEVMEPRLKEAGESEKLMTLKACLTADVKREVPSTCATQMELLTELDNTFGNKDKIVNTVLREVRALPKPLDSEYRKQVHLFRSVQRAVKDLTGLKREYEIKNQIVLGELEVKLPPKSFERWNVIIHDPSKPIEMGARFDTFLNFLKYELEMAEYASKDAPVKKEKDKPKNANTRSTQRGDGSGDGDSNCLVCSSSSGHAIYNCPEFKKMKPRERETKVRDLRLCFRCLKGGHIFSGCEEKTKVCTKCSRNHNVMLHSEGKPGGSSKGSDKFSKEKLDEIKKAQKLLEEAFKSGDSDKIKEASECVSKAASTSAAAATMKTTRTGSSSLLEKEGVKEKPVLMMTQFVTASTGRKIGTIWDGCSDTNYVTFKLAEELRLVGEPCDLSIKGVAGMIKTMKTKRYVLRLKSSRSGIIKLVVYGLEKVADVTRKADMGVLGKIFPDQAISSMERPTEIELMISQHNAGLMPGKKNVVGDLVLWQGVLGTVVSGAHEDLSENATTFFNQSETHMALSMMSVKEESLSSQANVEDLLEAEPNVSADEIPHCSRCLLVSAKEVRDLLSWFKYDQIGAACVPKCGGCRCAGCGPGGKEMSLKDQREMQKMEECLEYIPEGDHHKPDPHWHASYSYVLSPQILPNNHPSVKGMFLSTERRLDANPLWKDCYKEKIHDMVKRGAAIKMPPEMLSEWRGPVWYVNHLIALNPNSHTSPIRLVWNSSQAYKGVSLNSCLLKGPDVLNSLGGVMLRFRSGPEALIGDLTKMYNSVYLNLPECHLHRFLWRDDNTKEIDTYCIVVVNIGDRPAGCLAMLAVKNTAKLPEFKENQMAVETITESMYVDDILDSFDTKEQREAVARDCDRILGKGGFGRKPWVMSGAVKAGTVNLPGSVDSREFLPNLIQADETRALGVGYDVENDELFISPSVNFSRKRQKMRTGPDLKEDEVREATPELLNKKEILSQLMGIFDKAGLTLPFKMKGSILFRKVWQVTKDPGEKQVDWEKYVGDDLRGECIDYFIEMTRLGNVKFPRSLTPVIRFDVISSMPDLITFSDGSDDAFGACAYVRWRVANKENGEKQFDVRLVESRGKLCPLDMKGDTVKSETCGAVFAVRLKQFITLHAKLKFNRFFHFLDAMTVLGAIGKDSYGFQTFTANRVGEIQEGSDRENWAWIPTDDNPSDLITRGATPEALEKDSFWQRGPDWLVQDEETWPYEKKVPQEAEKEVVLLQRKAFTQVAVASESDRKCAEMQVVDSLLDIKKYSSWYRLLRVVTACAALAKAWKSRETPILANNGGRWTEGPRWLPRSLDQMTAAENAVLIKSQRDVKITQLDKLVAFKNEHGVLVTSGRFGNEEGFEYTVPILSTKCHAAKLLILEAHQVNHDGVDGTMYRLRKKAWVIQGRKSVKSLVYSCIPCREKHAERMSQIMGQLPSFRAQESPAFMYTTVDHFGPILVKGEVNKRVRMKVWGCIFSCLASRAVYADICYDYGTEAFLMTYRRFQAAHGAPRILYSDPGSCYVGAEAELKRFVKNLNKKDLVEYCIERQTEWVFHAPDAPHANGAAEATVKMLKRALKTTLGSSVMSFGDLQTMIFESAEVVNERPLGLKFSEDQKLSYLCPNSLLLGRVGPVIPTGPWVFSKKPLNRFKEVQRLVDVFWKEWQKHAFPKLVERPKWHTERRNLKKDDIVLLADDSFRSRYKLAVVETPITDKDGRVRKAEVMYKNITNKPARVYKKWNTGEKVCRDVRKMVLIFPVEEQAEGGIFADDAAATAKGDVLDDAEKTEAIPDDAETVGAIQETRPEF